MRRNTSFVHLCCNATKMEISRYFFSDYVNFLFKYSLSQNILYFFWQIVFYESQQIHHHLSVYEPLLILLLTINHHLKLSILRSSMFHIINHILNIPRLIYLCTCVVETFFSSASWRTFIVLRRIILKKRHNSAANCFTTKAIRAHRSVVCTALTVDKNVAITIKYLLVIITD